MFLSRISSASSQTCLICCDKRAVFSLPSSIFLLIRSAPRSDNSIYTRSSLDGTLYALLRSRRCTILTHALTASLVHGLALEKGSCTSDAMGTGLVPLFWNNKYYYHVFNALRQARRGDVACGLAWESFWEAMTRDAQLQHPHKDSDGISETHADLSYSGYEKPRRWTESLSFWKTSMTSRNSIPARGGKPTSSLPLSSYLMECRLSQRAIAWRAWTRLHYEFASLLHGSHVPRRSGWESNSLFSPIPSPGLGSSTQVHNEQNPTWDTISFS